MRERKRVQDHGTLMDEIGKLGEQLKLVRRDLSRRQQFEQDVLNQLKSLQQRSLGFIDTSDTANLNMTTLPATI